MASLRPTSASPRTPARRGPDLPSFSPLIGGPAGSCTQGPPTRQTRGPRALRASTTPLGAYATSEPAIAGYSGAGRGVAGPRQHGAHRAGSKVIRPDAVAAAGIDRGDRRWMSGEARADRNAQRLDAGERWHGGRATHGRCHQHVHAARGARTPHRAAAVGAQPGAAGGPRGIRVAGDQLVNRHAPRRRRDDRSGSAARCHRAHADDGHRHAEGDDHHRRDPCRQHGSMGLVLAHCASYRI